MEKWSQAHDNKIKRILLKNVEKNRLFIDILISLLINTVIFLKAFRKKSFQVDLRKSIFSNWKFSRYSPLKITFTGV